MLQDESLPGDLGTVDRGVNTLPLAEGYGKSHCKAERGNLG